MDVDSYLSRIGYRGARTATAETLRELHRRHMLSVPFENLDIGRRPIVIDADAFVRKVVGERRGGFCYELNGAFGTLLRELGFEVMNLSAGVARASGGFGPEFDHLALLVSDGNGQRWLADVGFGEGFMLPLRFAIDVDQADPAGVCRIVRDGEWYVLHRNDKPEYRFLLQAHALDEYAPRCHFHQTSSESSFTQGSVCSLATEDGRVTIANRRLIETRGGIRTERDLSDDEWEATLSNRFGVKLPRVV